MSFSRGPHTLKVTAALFVENRGRLVNALRQQIGPNSGACVLLEGGKEKNRYNTDSDDSAFRQVCGGAVDFWDIIGLGIINR